MKTIAQQLNVKKFPFVIKDKHDKVIYVEHDDGTWYRRVYDENNNLAYYEDYEKFWVKIEYDSEGNLLYKENSKGIVVDDRAKPCEENQEKKEKTLEINGTTIAQRLNVTDFPFEINDKNGNEIYRECSDRSWCIQNYDSEGNLVQITNT